MKRYVLFRREGDDLFLLASFSLLQDCLDYIKKNHKNCPLVIGTVDLDSSLAVNYVDGKLFIN